MPHVIVKMLPGRTAQQKKKLADDLTRTVIASLGVGAESISVGVEDVEKSDWEAKVNKPDLLDRPEQVYRQRGLPAP